MNATVTLIRNLVVIVDDDESVRESLPDLLRELGYASRTFTSAEDFLASDSLLHTRCIILDVAMPGMNGPALKRELSRRHQDLPTIFITAHKDDFVRRRLMQEGAIECLFKPFSETALIAALDAATRSQFS